MSASPRMNSSAVKLRKCEEKKKRLEHEYSNGFSSSFPFSLFFFFPKEEGNEPNGEKITSIQLGKKSGRVFATGSEDAKVNVFAIGSPDALMVLPPILPLLLPVFLSSSRSSHNSCRLWLVTPAQ